MSDIVNLPQTFAAKPEVFGSALIPMNQHDLLVHGEGVPVTHWFVVGYKIGDRGFVECYAADAAGNGDIDAIDYEVRDIRHGSDGSFRRTLFQICSPEGLDELIQG